MTKYLYITGSMPPLRCGVGFYTNRLLDYLPRGFDLLATEGLDSHNGANATFYTPDWKLRRIFSLQKTVKNGNYDIVHIQYPTRGYKRELGINKLPYLIRVFTKSKIVVTLHEYHGSGWLGRSRNLVTTLPAHKILVSNPYDFESLPKILRKKTEIVPIGSNVPLAPKNRSAYEAILKHAGFNAGKKTAVYFGFPYPNKGIETAIEAAKLGGFQLLLLTELDTKDPYQKGLRELTDEAVASGAKIHVSGFLEDTEFSEVIQECDYFVLPQQLPLTAKSSTAITAANHKLIVISKAAHNPHFNEPFKHQENAILLDDMSPKTLAQAVASAPDKAEWGVALKDLANRFDWQQIASRHQAVYKELLP